MDPIPPSSPLPSSQQSSSSTPSKRKRDILPTPPASSPSQKNREIHLNTNMPSTLVTTSEEPEAHGSPRTKVAYKFKGLQLDDRGTVSRLELQKPDAPLKGEEDNVMEGNAVRKRVKVIGAQEKSSAGGIMSDRDQEIPETPDKRASSIVIGSDRTVDSVLKNQTTGAALYNEVDPVVFKGSAMAKAKGGLGRAYPSINRLADSRSRVSKPNKRSGTPPLLGNVDAGLEINEGRTSVLDQEGAAMTWHDDEITGHNPDDPDDDGEGINGIGFKPTPAMAYARKERRRQQMLEYKNREAREARAKRSERRKAGECPRSSREDEEIARRVRFLEGEVRGAISFI